MNFTMRREEGRQTFLNYLNNVFCAGCKGESSKNKEVISARLMRFSRQQFLKGARMSEQQQKLWSFKRRVDNMWYWECMDWEGIISTSAPFPDHVSCIANAQQFGWEGAVPKPRIPR